MFWRHERLSAGADGPSLCLLGQQAWQGMMGYGSCSTLRLSLYVTSESLSPPCFLSHTHSRPVLWFLQQNTALIKHSAVGNYLHLFKLLFTPFVWRADVRSESEQAPELLLYASENDLCECVCARVSYVVLSKYERLCLRVCSLWWN